MQPLHATGWARPASPRRPDRNPSPAPISAAGVAGFESRNKLVRARSPSLRFGALRAVPGASPGIPCIEVAMGVARHPSV